MSAQKPLYDAQSKIWSAERKQHVYDYNCSIGQVMFMTMRNYPNKVVQISADDDSTMTNGDALRLAICIATHLNKLNLSHLDVVGIVARNTKHLLPVVVGCLLHSVPLHAVNVGFEKETLEHLFNITKPKIVFCDGCDYAKVHAATKSFQPTIYTLSEHLAGVDSVHELFAQTSAAVFYQPKRLLLGGEQTALILNSSGTTGLPKAVCISNQRLMYVNRFLTSEDIGLCFSGIDWMTGVYMLTLSCTQSCVRLVTVRPFTVDYFVALVEKYNVTFSLLTANYAVALANSLNITSASCLAKVRLINIGGAAISSRTLQRLKNLLHKSTLSINYGFTEAGNIAVGFGMLANNCVGNLVPNVRVRIVNENGENLGPNEVGEIYVHNDCKWAGYYNNTVATQNMQDSNGWIRSGDLGYFDDKHQLYVIERKKDILKYQGMHYWPNEIEHVILELPSVQEVAVVGLYNETHGDAAAAVIVKTPESNLTEDDVENHVKQRLLEHFKHLHGGVCFVKEIPTNANGKVLKHEVKKLFAASENDQSILL